MKIKSLFSSFFYSALTVFSPELNTRIKFWRFEKRSMNLEEPETLTEKLSWLKLNKYSCDSLVKICADKYAVREYIKKCGCEEILNDLIGVWDSAKDIDWDALPSQFVLKWNFGAGMNIICADKSELDMKAVAKQMNKWGRVKYHLSNAEMQYKGIKKKIICEKFLVDQNSRGALPDYKVYCFHGNPLAILVMHDRGQTIKAEFFDSSWGKLDPPSKYKAPSNSTPKPKCFNEMMRVAEKLSQPFPFVRCDFYVVNDKLYFGELTFTPAGGLYTSETKIDGKDMADFIDLNRV